MRTQETVSFHPLANICRKGGVKETRVVKNIEKKVSISTVALIRVRPPGSAYRGHCRCTWHGCLW